MEETGSLTQLLCVYLTAGIAILGLALGGYTKAAGRRKPRPWRDGELGPSPNGGQAGEGRPAPAIQTTSSVSRPGAPPGGIFHRPTTTSLPKAAGKSRAERPLRRSGETIPAQVTIGNDDSQLIDATVVDRSRGGLGLALPQEVRVGSALRVRSMNYEESGPWVEVEVRHCRRRGDQWLVGCKFRQTLPLNVLLLFG